MFSNPINRWWTVAAGAVGTGLGAGVIFLRAMPVVAPQIISEYGWSRSFGASWIAVFMFSSGLGLVMFGRHVARYGIRGPAIAYLAAFGLLLGALSWLPAVQPLFILAFLGLGLAGAAGCAMPYVIAICATFTERRGFALGLMSTGGILLHAVLPSLTALFLSLYGWRHGLLAIAAISSMIPILCLVFLVRTPPEVVRENSSDASRGTAGDRTYLGDKVFWLLFFSIFGFSLAGIGLSANLIPLLEDRGLSTVEAAWMLSLTGLTAWMGRPICGWALDRFFAPYVTMVVFAIAAVGTLFILVGGAGALVYAGIIILGLCLGGEADLLTYLTSRYFAIEQVSRVVGVLWLAWAWGAGIGAFVAGLSFDLSGSYEGAIWIYEAIIFLSAALLAALPAYRAN